MSDMSMTTREQIIELLQTNDVMGLAELTEQLQKDKSNLGKVVRKLESEGLVESFYRVEGRSRYKFLRYTGRLLNFEGIVGELNSLHQRVSELSESNNRIRGEMHKSLGALENKVRLVEEKLNIVIELLEEPLVGNERKRRIQFKKNVGNLLDYLYEDSGDDDFPLSE